jgi:hypothetical protein
MRSISSVRPLAGLVLGVATGLLGLSCNGGLKMGSRQPAAEQPKQPPLQVLGHFQVDIEAGRWTITPTDADGKAIGPPDRGPSLPSEGTIEKRTQPLTVLGQLPAVSQSSTTGTGIPAASTILVKQTAPAMIDGACETIAAAQGDTIPGPFTGTCSPIDLRSGYADDEIIRSYVEITSVNSTVGVTTFYVNAGSDGGLNTVGTFGLWSYGKLAEVGVTHTSTAPLDRSSRYWYIHTTAVPTLSGRVSFKFVVKGERVESIRRAATAPCAASAAHRATVNETGQYIAYVTSTPACAGTLGGGPFQIYRYDVINNVNVLVSSQAGNDALAANGSHQHPAISANGDWIAWVSNTDNSLATGLLTMGGTDAEGNTDPNTADDIYLRQVSVGGGAGIRVMSVSTLTTTTSGVAAANPAISPSGEFVSFDTTADLDIFGNDGSGQRDVYRRGVFGFTELASPPSDGTRTAAATNRSISDGFDGAVAFQSTDRVFYGGAMGAGVTEVFVRCFNGACGYDGVNRVSVADAGATPNGNSQNPVVSGTGDVVAFESVATNMLAAASTGGRSHVYVRRPNLAGSIIRADFGSDLVTEANGNATRPSLTDEGRIVVFSSTATNLDANDSAAGLDAYMYDVFPLVSGGTQDIKRRRNILISASRRDERTNGAITSFGAFAAGQGSYAVFTAPAATNLAGGAGGIFLAPLR